MNPTLPDRLPGVPYATTCDPERPEVIVYTCGWDDRFRLVKAILGDGTTPPISHPDNPHWFALSLTIKMVGPLTEDPAFHGMARTETVEITVNFGLPLST